MFVTIGRARVSAGHVNDLKALVSEWKTTVRSKGPGVLLEFSGDRAGDPNAIVFVALAQDEATYRHLAELPEQEAFYRRMLDHLESEPTWEDVEKDVMVPLSRPGAPAMLGEGDTRPA